GRDLGLGAAEVARDRHVLHPLVLAARELDRVQQAQLPEPGIELQLAEQRAAELHDRLNAGLGVRHHIEDVGGGRQAAQHLAHLGAGLVEVGIGDAGHGGGLLARVAQTWVAFSAYRRTAEGASAALTGADMGVSLGAGSVARVAGSATAWGACDAGAWAIAAARAAAIAISSSKSSQAAAADSERASAVAAAARHFRIAIACLL